MEFIGTFVGLFMTDGCGSEVLNIKINIPNNEDFKALERYYDHSLDDGCCMVAAGKFSAQDIGPFMLSREYFKISVVHDLDSDLLELEGFELHT